MFEFLESAISLDASEYSAGADEAIDATDGVADATDEAGESLLAIDKRGVAAGGALAGLGTAMQSALDDTADLRESLGRTAASTELTSDEMNGLARSISDASFPIEDSVATLDALAQQGVDTEAEMESVALAMDNIADATGTTAESVANNAGPALRAFGHDLEDTAEHADTFTFVARNTTMSVEDFSSNVERLAPEIQEMGMSLDDTAAVMAALEEEGITGRQAITEFRQAANDAEGDQQALANTLGLSEDAINKQSQALSEAEGITQDQSAAANESLSAMDDLRAGFDRARLALGDYLGPVSTAAPLLQGLGVSALALSTINFGALAPSFAAVSAASLPVTGPILAIGAALGVIGGAVAAIAWRSDAIEPMETLSWIADRAGDGLGWLRDRLFDGIDAINRFYPPVRLAREVYDRNLFGIADTTDAAVSLVGDSVDWLVDKVNTIPGINIGGDDVDVDEDAVEEAGEETAESFETGRDSDFEVGGVAIPEESETDFAAGGQDVPDDPEPASGSELPSPSGSTPRRDEELELSRETIRDLSDALVERVEGSALEVLLEIDDRELDRLIENRVDAAITQ